MLLQTLLHWPNIYFVRALAVHQFSVLKGISVHSATCAVKYTHPGWHSHRPEMRVQHNKEQKSRVNPASSNGNAHDDGKWKWSWSSIFPLFRRFESLLLARLTAFDCVGV